MSVYDWIIVGGGIHGTYLAALLRRYNKSGKMAVIDPHPHLLHRWLTLTQRCGMKYLRSPASHSLEPDYNSLLRFSAKNPTIHDFLLPYHRPSLELFNRHAHWVINQFSLQDAHIQDLVIQLNRNKDAFILKSRNKDFRSKQVILALGPGEEINDDILVRNNPVRDKRIQHLFSPEFFAPPADSTIALLGAGLSGGQYALKRLRKSPRPIHLINPTPLTSEKYDANPALVGPKQMKAFLETSDYEERYRMLLKNRAPGTLAPDVYKELKHEIDEGHIIFHEDFAVKIDSRKEYLIVNFKREAPLRVNHVILATGYKQTLPGQSLIHQIAEEFSYPLTKQGFPRLDSYLQWGPKLFISGALSALETGSSAYNIQGAHRSGIRILNFLFGKTNIYRFQE